MNKEQWSLKKDNSEEERETLTLDDASSKDTVTTSKKHTKKTSTTSGKSISGGSAVKGTEFTSTQLRELSAVDKIKKTRNIMIAAGGIVLSLITLSTVYFVNQSNSEQNILRKSQELKVDTIGDWVSLSSFGIDTMLPEDMKDCTPEELKSFLRVVKEIGYDDEISAEAGIITIPDIITSEFDARANGEDAWNKMISSLNRVLQQTYNGLIIGISNEISYETDANLGDYMLVQSEYQLQQYIKNDETGETEARDETVTFRVKSAIVDVNDRPVMLWAGYRPGYDEEEETKQNVRLTTLMQSVIATGDVIGVDLNMQYENVNTLIVDSDDKTALLLNETSEPDANVGENKSASATQVEDVLNMIGWFKQDDGSYVSYPKMVKFKGQDDNYSQKITAEEAYQIYLENKDNYTDDYSDDAKALREEFSEYQKELKDTNK